VTERAKKSINKTTKKIEIILRKMQNYIKELDFTKYEEFMDNPGIYDAQKCTN
jgi:hypothetical protein